MLLFDNLIGDADRNAGNILMGPRGEMILIDHSRAFITDKRLPQKIERVDAELWERMKTLTRADLTGALGSWEDEDASGAGRQRRLPPPPPLLLRELLRLPCPRVLAARSDRPFE